MENKLDNYSTIQHNCRTTKKYKRQYKYITTSKDYKISESTEHAVRVDKFSDSSIDMYIRCFTVTDDWSEWLKVKERLAIEIKEIVEKMELLSRFLVLQYM